MTAPEPQTAAEGPLGRTVAKALGWSSLAQILGRVGNFVVGIVLARLLTQEDFGLFAVALVAINLLIVANDLGVIAAVIRWPGDVRTAAGTAATLSLLFSGGLFVAVVLVAPSFANAMGSPEAANLVRVIALAILIDGASAVPQALLIRDFRNDRLALAELAGFVLGTPVTIVMAVLDAGPWSIVAGRIVGAAAVGLVVVASSPFRVVPRMDREVAGRLIRFGAPLALSAVVAQAVLNVDYIIVGRVLGPVELGVYLLAFNLSSWPATLVSAAVARVAFAGFSRLVEDRRRLTEAFPRSIGVAASVLMPTVVILLVLAPEVIEFLYGARWRAAATPLRFLVLLGGMRIVIDLLIDLSIADARPRVALGVRTAWLVAVVPALAVGATAAGLRGVGIAHVTVAAAVVLPLLVLDARRSGIRTRVLGAQVVRPLLSAGAATVAMVVVLPVASAPFTRLAVGGACGGLVYAATLVPRNPLLRWAQDRLGRRAVSAGGGEPERD